MVCSGQLKCRLSLAATASEDTLPQTQDGVKVNQSYSEDNDPGVIS